MRLVPRGAALTHSVLYLRITLLTTLALKLFRGEPAISGFDWNFTPSHKSSKSFSTDPGSVLHLVLPKLQPAHGSITRFRVYVNLLIRPIKTCFRYGSTPKSLTLQINVTRRLILQKARYHPLMGSNCL